MFAFRYSLEPHQNGGLHLANAGDTSGNDWAWPWSGSPAAAAEFPDVIGNGRLQRRGPHPSDDHYAGRSELYARGSICPGVLMHGMVTVLTYW